MSAFLWQSVRDAFSLLVRHATVAVPVAIFVLLERTATTGSSLLNGLSLDTRLDTVVHTLFSVSFLAAFALLLAVKVISIMFTNSDMYFAFAGRENRLKAVVREIKFTDYLAYYLMAAIWYGAFAFVALGGAHLLYDLIKFEVRWANVVLLVVFVILFPVFYAGLSVFPFLTLLRRLKVTPRRFDLPICVELYKFYSLRSLLDITFVAALPIGIFRIEAPYWVRLGIVLVCSIGFAAFMRTVSIRYKSLLLSPTTKPL